MKRSLLAVWLILPIGAWAYHEGPGQDLSVLDDVDALLRDAHSAAGGGAWGDAVLHYEKALGQLPAARVAEARRIRLELSKARMNASQLPVAGADLEDLVEELSGDPDADLELLAEARSALANAQFYLTWLMRLEGLPRERWEPEIEAARQTYALLAEQAEAEGDGEGARVWREDLESAVRLLRMELQELQGLPLPSQ